MSDEEQEKKPRTRKWSHHYLVDAYILARAGMDNKAIAKSLGIKSRTFYEWAESNEYLEKALAKARNSPANGGTNETFIDYVYRHLSEDLKPTFERLLRYSKEEDTTLDDVERTLKGHGLQQRMTLFVHALVQTNFNTSEACRIVGIGKKTLDGWQANYPDFVTLMDEIRWHMKNYFESAMIDLVKAKNPFAIIHVNKTKNADRGYGDKLEIKHSGQVNHLVGVLSLDAMKRMPIDLRTQLLDWIDEDEKENGPKPVTPA